MTQQPKKRRKPLGQPIEYSEADLDTLSEVNAADLLNAATLWQQEAPAPLKQLLRAEKQDTQEKKQ